MPGGEEAGFRRRTQCCREGFGAHNGCRAEVLCLCPAAVGGSVGGEVGDQYGERFLRHGLDAVIRCLGRLVPGPLPGDQ